MDIHSDSYKVAALSEQEEALEIIRNAEASIAHLTGNPTVTLIAYEKAKATVLSIKRCRPRQYHPHRSTSIPPPTAA